MTGQRGVSIGKAMVGYSNRDEAANAMKKLFFEDELGD